MEDLYAKVAVVTGAGGGIGLATGRALARLGMRVVLADVNASRLEPAAQQCRDDGLDVTPVVVDVSSFDENRRLADAAYDAYGAVHLVHLNAGIATGANLFDSAPDAWHRTIGVNLLGVVWGISAFVPRMIDGGDEGLVLATSSGAGAEGTSYNQPAYAATKMAVVSIMEGLYGQLRDTRARVRAGIVFPPLTATNLAGSPAAMPAVERALRESGVPAALVQPEAVAEMIVDGIRRGRFFIRAREHENDEFFARAIPDEYFRWNDRIVQGRAHAQLTDGAPDDYLW